MAIRRATLTFALLQIALGLVLIAGLWFAWPAWRLGMITEQVRKSFPGVPLFSSVDLGAWMADAAKSKPFIVDVRSEPEFDVSHLLGAVRIDPSADLATAGLPEDHARVIVTYCTTGESSAAFAARLQEAGYSRVFALEGGIIRWANEGRAMTDGKSIVTRVHPGNERGRTLLRRVNQSATPATH